MGVGGGVGVQRTTIGVMDGWGTQQGDLIHPPDPGQEAPRAPTDASVRICPTTFKAFIALDLPLSLDTEGPEPWNPGTLRTNEIHECQDHIILTI